MLDSPLGTGGGGMRVVSSGITGGGIRGSDLGTEPTGACIVPVGGSNGAWGSITGGGTSGNPPGGEPEGTSVTSGGTALGA